MPAEPSQREIEEVGRALFDELYGRSELIPWDTYEDKEAFYRDALVAIRALDLLREGKG